jgi:hypothetical protein
MDVVVFVWIHYNIVNFKNLNDIQLEIEEQHLNNTEF